MPGAEKPRSYSFGGCFQGPKGPCSFRSQVSKSRGSPAFQERFLRSSTLARRECGQGLRGTKRLGQTSFRETLCSCGRQGCRPHSRSTTPTSKDRSLGTPVGRPALLVYLFPRSLGPCFYANFTLTLPTLANSTSQRWPAVAKLLPVQLPVVIQVPFSRPPVRAAPSLAR